MGTQAIGSILYYFKKDKTGKGLGSTHSGCFKKKRAGKLGLTMGFIINSMDIWGVTSKKKNKP